MVKGRPSLTKLLEKLFWGVSTLHTELEGFPASVEANEIWKDLWLEETHHSTALEGNTLNSREIYNLVEKELVTGTKEMRHYLEVLGYSQAARWLYEEGVAAHKRQDRTITLQHISQIHSLLMRLVWDAYPPVSEDQPGQFRKGPAKIRGSSLKLPAAGDVLDLIRNLIIEINGGPGDLYVIEWAGRIHAKFEAIHPFADGNGRTGRLLMNYLLITQGYPPAIILKSQQAKYLRALEKAQGKNPDYTMLTELIIRTVRDNLNKLLLPRLSGQENLVPLSALAEGTPYEPSYLRRLAQEGRLKAVKDDSIWKSSKKWMQEYIDSRSTRGRR